MLKQPTESRRTVGAARHAAAVARQARTSWTYASRSQIGVRPRPCVAAGILAHRSLASSA